MNATTKALVGSVLTLVFSSEIAAQQTPEAMRLAPVTVCEILASPQQFNGRNVAVLGRLATTDEGWWLAEDDCGRKLVTDGHTWPNSIWLHCCYKPAPDPPTGSLVLDQTVLSEKLHRVRGTTKLRTEKRWFGGGRSIQDGKVVSTPASLRDVREDWAVAYGRVEAPSELRTEIGGDGRLRGAGFGHLGAAPAQLVIKQKNLQTIPDDSPQAQDHR